MLLTEDHFKKKFGHDTHFKHNLISFRAKDDKKKH